MFNEFEMVGPAKIAASVGRRAEATTLHRLTGQRPVLHLIR
jgi:hypothetical protein